MRFFRVLAAFAVIALAAPLGACDTIDNLAAKASAVAGYTVTQNQIDSVRATYNGAYLAPAANYRELPKCAPGTSFNILTNRCRDNAIVRQLQAADRTISEKFTALQAQLDAGNGKGSVSAYTALKSAVEAAVAILTTYKINQL